MLTGGKNMGKHKGRSAQIARFKSAAKKCRGKPNYRKCMGQQLKGKKK